MPGKLRLLSAREVLRILHGYGFQVIGSRGSHCKLLRTGPGGSSRALIIPLHRELRAGTLNRIYRRVKTFIPEAKLERHFFWE